MPTEIDGTLAKLNGAVISGAVESPVRRDLINRMPTKRACSDKDVGGCGFRNSGQQAVLKPVEAELLNTLFFAARTSHLPLRVTPKP